MDTKQTRVVVTFILAVATLATMGFAPADPGKHGLSFFADVVCEVEASLSPTLAILDLLDEPCYADLIDLVEMEIDSGLIGPADSESLLSRIDALSRSGGSQSVEYLSLIEVDADEPVFSPSSSAFARRAGDTEWFANYLELEEPIASVAAVRSRHRLGNVEWFVNYLELEEPVASVPAVGSRHRAGNVEWFANYLELIEPGTDPE